MSSIKSELASLRIPLEDIVIATKDFANENLLKQGQNSYVYKGELLLPSRVVIDVVIRKFSGNMSDSFFYEEIERISSFKHKKVVSLIGFCDEKDEKMIVMEHVANGSLYENLGDPTTLSWCQRLNICVGAAFVLDNIHNAVTTFKILLDKDWQEKVLIGIESDTIFSHADMCHSLGVILLAVLYGRKATSEDVHQYLTKSRYEELDDMIDPNIRNQMLPESLSTVSELAYDCLKGQPDQPFTYRRFHQIFEKLKEASEVQWKHENVFCLQYLSFKSLTLDQRTYLEKEYASLRIPLQDIATATKDFAEERLLKQGQNSDVYKGELLFPSGVVIDVVIRKFKGYMSDTFFCKIVKRISRFKGKNVVSFVGFCDEKDEKMIVMEHVANGSLDIYLDDPTTLTWCKRLHICFDALDNIRNSIKCFKILLDKDWQAKVLIGTESDTENCPSSDVYCMGVIMLEVLYGMKARIEDVKHYLAHKELDDRMIDPNLRKQMHPESLSVFLETASDCLQEQPDKQRPEIVKSLSF